MAITSVHPTQHEPSEPAPLAIRAQGVSLDLGGTTLLDDVDLTVPAGALVAIGGGSGAGKTTLVEVLAGLRPSTRGTVRYGAAGATAAAMAGTGHVGVVPQDDIIHGQLPLRRTLLYAARLRLLDGDRDRAEARVDEVLELLGLAGRADVVVSSLSGGQRKRASIAVELLTQPDVLFLDEPTSGLDPVRAADVMDALRTLSDRGVTVVLTSHHPSELERCDLVVFLAAGGRLCFAGPPAEAVAHFGIDDLASVHRMLDERPDEWAARWRVVAPEPVVHAVDGGDRPVAPTGSRAGASTRRQWAVLTGRSAEVVARNRLTLAILLGSPALVIAMMAVLFPAGAFDAADPAALGPAQTAFWLAFSAFFFGLTYGLLQIVTERAVLRRERFAGLRLSAYLASKITVLLPVLVVVDVAMLGVLRLLDRLPSAGWDVYGELLVTMVLTAAAGLVIGLAASAAVADATQATLALPMICFPQVLFAGAVVPVAQMAAAGTGISAAMTTRWSFESLGRSLGLGTAGPYEAAFTGSATAGWLALAVVTAAATVAAMVVLRWRTSRPDLGRG